MGYSFNVKWLSHRKFQDVGCKDMWREISFMKRKSTYMDTCSMRNVVFQSSKEEETILAHFFLAGRGASKHEPYLNPYIKINSKGKVNLNVKDKQ